MQQDIIHLIRDFQDRSIRWLLETPDNVRGLLLVIASDLAEKIDYHRLQKLDRTFIPDDFRKREADMIFTVPFTEDPREPSQEIIIYILIEHQSTYDPTMPFRIFYYMAQIWEMQRREFENQKKPIHQWRFRPIIPIVFYTGHQDWEMSLELKNLIELSASLERFIPQYDVILLNLKAMAPESLVKNDHPFGWVLRIIQNEDASSEEFAEVLGLAIKHLELMSPEEEVNWEKLIRFLLALIYHRREPLERESFLNIIETNIVEKLRREELKKMKQTIAQVLIEEGKEIGKEMGKEIGIITAKQEDLIKLLRFKFGSPPEDTQDIIEKIKSIQKIDQLDAIFERILAVNTLEELKSELLKY